ncbi:MAG: HlyD family secretion protein, partial [Deltaproteobacteria bacterium]|nr:HlyD family secretion protein [Deltaproteobacteria bacterium]
IAEGRGRPDLRFELEQFLRVPMTLLEGRQGEATRGSQRLEGVGRSARSTSRKSGSNWVAAMKAAAKRCELEPLVSYQEVAEPVESFDAFVERGALTDRVFAALFGPLPGQTSAVVVSDTRLAATGADPWELAPELAGAAPAAPATASTPGTDWERVRRFIVPAVLGVALIAFLAPVILWIHYRSTHVVSRDAMVRGHIAEIGARLDGVVMSIDVDAGDSVQAGQVVARLENRHFEAKVRQASSQLEKAGRELEVERLAIANERLRLSSSLNEAKAELSAVWADVEASDSLADEASRRLAVQKSLAEQGMVPEEQVRTAETELRTARAMAAASRAKKNAARAGQDLAETESAGLAVREKRISVLESEISAYRAELALAEANLESAVIRAPDDGAVVRRIVEPGGSSTVGQPIISLWVGEEIWVEAWVDEADLAKFEVGSPATVSMKSYPDREFTGVVERIAVSTDFELPDEEVPQPRDKRMRDAPVVSVRIRLDDPEEDLFPGLSAVVGIRKKDR